MHNVMGAVRVKPFLIYYTATAHTRINVKGSALFKRCKVHWKFVPAKSDFNAEIQNLIEYF